jgi:hypothetical protein
MGHAHRDRYWWRGISVGCSFLELRGACEVEKVRPVLGALKARRPRSDAWERHGAEVVTTEMAVLNGQGRLNTRGSEKRLH